MSEQFNSKEYISDLLDQINGMPIERRRDLFIENYAGEHIFDECGQLVDFDSCETDEEQRQIIDAIKASLLDTLNQLGYCNECRVATVYALIEIAAHLIDKESFCLVTKQLIDVIERGGDISKI